MKRPRRPSRTLPTSLASTNHKWGTFLPSQTSHKTEMRPRHRPSRRIRQIPWPVTRTPRLMLRRLPKQALLPWMGFFLSPRLLKSLMRTTYDAQDICLWTQPRRSRSLPLWSRLTTWSRCRQLFPGPSRRSQALAFFQGLLLQHQVLANCSRTAVMLLPGSLVVARGPDGAPTSQPSFSLWCCLSCCPQMLELLPLPSRAPWPSLQDLLPRSWCQDRQWKTLCPTRFFLPSGPVTPACSAASTSLLPPPGLPCGQQVPKTPVSAASSPVLPPHLPRWLSRPPRL